MKYKRPRLIEVLCVVGGMYWAAQVWLLFSSNGVTQPLYKILAFGYGDWAPLFLVASFAAALAGLLGLWMMKKWGLICTVVLAVVYCVVLQFALGGLEVSPLLYFAAVLAAGFSQYKKLS